MSVPAEKRPPRFVLTEPPDVGLERLYREYREVLYRYLRYAVGDEAEDLTHAVMLNAHAAIDRGGRPRHMRAWLFTIARNELIHHLDKHRRLTLVSPHELSQDRGAGDRDRPSRMLDWLTNPELIVHFERLSRREQQLLTLRFVFDLTSAEIARVLGYASSTSVRVTQVRALNKLGAAMAAPASGTRAAFACSRLPAGLRRARLRSISVLPRVPPRVAGRSELQRPWRGPRECRNWC